MSDKVIDVDFKKKVHAEGSLMDQLVDVIDNIEEDISVSSVVGILEILKMHLVSASEKNVEQ